MKKLSHRSMTSRPFLLSTDVTGCGELPVQSPELRVPRQDNERLRGSQMGKIRRKRDKKFFSKMK